MVDSFDSGALKAALPTRILVLLMSCGPSSGIVLLLIQQSEELTIHHNHVALRLFGETLSSAPESKLEYLSLVSLSHIHDSMY